MFASGCSKAGYSRCARDGACVGREERRARGASAQRIPDENGDPKHDAHRHLQLSVPGARRLRRYASAHSLALSTSTRTFTARHESFFRTGAPLLLLLCTLYVFAYFVFVRSTSTPCSMRPVLFAGGLTSDSYTSAVQYSGCLRRLTFAASVWMPLASSYAMLRVLYNRIRNIG